MEKVVAKDLGGQPVEPSTQDLSERRLINIVEEMAIASGVPVPGVWIMREEPGINAFAAGTDPSNAVIGVTRGTLERLTRAELQGVVAHEFSHILNGDMKLNMRLIGWIFGLVMFAMLGRMLLQSFRFIGGGRSRDSDRNGAAIVIAIFLAGAAIWLVGSVGVLFAKMLQAAISRQREFLADASAVQFTRDPDGIAGALKKIGGFQAQGRILSPKAVEARHMFFAGSALSRFMATHPPLSTRILAIQPAWGGEMLSGKSDPVTNSEFGRGSSFAPSSSLNSTEGGFTQLGDSRRLDQQLGSQIRDQLRAGNIHSFSKDEAKGVLLGLLLATDADGREQGIQILKNREVGPERTEAISEWSAALSIYGAEKKLALIDLSLSWLRKMGRDEARVFVDESRALIAADGEVNMFEFMLQKVIERHIEIGLSLKPVPAMRYRNLVELREETANLLQMFALLGGGDAALELAGAEFEEHTGLKLEVADTSLGKVAQALERMDAATPLVKQQILRMCSLVVLADRRVEDKEMVLLRATAEAMGAPIPPIILNSARKQL